MVKKTILLLSASLLLVACNGSKPELTSQIDTLSWAMGENTAKSIIDGQIIEIDNDVFLKAVEHTLKGGEQPLSDSAYQQAIQYIYAMAQMKQMQAAAKQQGDVNKTQEEYFKNLEATNKNVKKHSSGFYYEVLKQGKGPNVKYAESISFDYRSYLMLTGEPYDMTYGKRPPIVHVVGNPMFRGLIDGIQLMNAGSIYRFYFPYQLAFGEQGSGDIPGYTPFIYEIEIHEIVKD